jgi:hypothetical protein
MIDRGVATIFYFNPTTYIGVVAMANAKSRLHAQLFIARYRNAPDVALRAALKPDDGRSRAFMSVLTIISDRIASDKGGLS